MPLPMTPSQSRYHALHNENVTENRDRLPQGAGPYQSLFPNTLSARAAALRQSKLPKGPFHLSVGIIQLPQE